MSGKTIPYANEYLQLFFWGNEIIGIARNDTSPLTEFWFSLHTADPGPAGSSQATNEATYAGYARIPVLRSSAGFSISGNTASLAANIGWSSVGAGSGQLTYFGIGSSNVGAGFLFYSGPMSPPQNISPGFQPTLTAGTTIQEL